MAQIIEVVTEDGKTFEQARNVPGETRILKELRRVFPGAHFVRCHLTPAGADKPVPCVELRYNPPGTHEAAPIAAIPVDDNPNTRALTPLSLLRHAIRRLGYDLTVREIRSKVTLDRIWEFHYDALTPPDAPSPDETKASDTDGC